MILVEQYRPPPPQTHLILLLHFPMMDTQIHTQVFSALFCSIDRLFGFIYHNVKTFPLCTWLYTYTLTHYIVQMADRCCVGVTSGD